jgi:hypothetical protein
MTLCVQLQDVLKHRRRLNKKQFWFNCVSKFTNPSSKNVENRKKKTSQNFKVSRGLMKLSITIFMVTAFNRVTNGHNWLHLVTFVKEKLTVCMYVVY